MLEGLNQKKIKLAPVKTQKVSVLQNEGHLSSPSPPTQGAVQEKQRGIRQQTYYKKLSLPVACAAHAWDWVQHL